MSKNILNVPMYSVRGNQEIIDEIKDEYIKGGHNLCFVQPREKFYKDFGKKFAEFDLISHALVLERDKVWNICRDRLVYSSSH